MTLIEYRHESILKLVNELPGARTLAKGLMQVDRNFANDPKTDRASRYKLYKDLFGKRCKPAEVERTIGGLVRKQTDVEFHSRTPGVFSPASALINRLLALVLIETGHVKLRCAKEFDERNTADGKIMVTFRDGEDDNTQIEYDQIIKRWGPAACIAEHKLSKLYRVTSPLRCATGSGISGKADIQTLRFFRDI